MTMWRGASCQEREPNDRVRETGIFGADCLTIQGEQVAKPRDILKNGISPLTFT
jgi:hypothetical protein